MHTLHTYFGMPIIDVDWLELTLFSNQNIRLDLQIDYKLTLFGKSVKYKNTTHFNIHLIIY